MNETYGASDGERKLLDWIDAHIVWYGQSAFRITGENGEVIYIDAPRARRGAPLADYIFVTHDHSDHWNPRAVEALMKSGTHVIVPASMKASGADAGLSTVTLAPGENARVGSIAVEAVASYNAVKRFHPKAKGYVGYVLTIGALRIYHAGDTDHVPELDAVRADIAMLPVGGMFTMNAEQAHAASEAIGARVVIPMHYGTVPFTRKSGRRFAAGRQGVTKLLSSE